ASPGNISRTSPVASASRSADLRLRPSVLLDRTVLQLLLLWRDHPRLRLLVLWSDHVTLRHDSLALWDDRLVAHLTAEARIYLAWRLALWPCRWLRSGSAAQDGRALGALRRPLVALELRAWLHGRARRDIGLRIALEALDLGAGLHRGARLRRAHHAAVGHAGIGAVDVLRIDVGIPEALLAHGVMVGDATPVIGIMLPGVAADALMVAVDKADPVGVDVHAMAAPVETIPAPERPEHTVSDAEANSR